MTITHKLYAKFAEQELFAQLSVETAQKLNAEMGIMIIMQEITDRANKKMSSSRASDLIV